MINVKKKFCPLLIEFDYKVINNASGQIVRAFWENVPDREFSPTIICAKKESPFKSKWPLYEFKSYPTLTRLGHGLRKTSFPDLANLPDMFWHLWGKNVLRHIDDVLKENSFNYIHSVSCPMGDSLVALEIKKRTGLPWIAQFHDPFIGNRSEPFRFQYFKKRFEKMEYEIAKNADFIIHTNSVIEDTWKERYGSLVERKMKALPLSFNTVNLPKRKKKERGEKIIISHIGEIYSSRSLKDIVDALFELFADNPSLRNRIEFQLVGRVKQSEREYIHSKKLDDVFEFAGLLPPDRLTSFYQKTDVFLALDVNKVQSPSYPSKLMMYYYYQKPILGVTTPGSVMENDFNQSGHKCFYYGDKEGIKRYLLSLLTGDSNCVYDVNYWKRFTVEAAISDYIKVVNKILK